MFQEPRDVMDRMRAHKAALSTFGVDDLNALGSMEIGGTVLVAPTGLTSPRVGDLYGRETICRAARLPDRTITDRWREVFSVPAKQLRAEPPRAKLPFGRSYWAAHDIRLPPGTVVVLTPPLAHLTIVVHRLVLGEGVTFTWERPEVAVPGGIGPAPTRPDMPAPTADGRWGVEGERGIDGESGNAGVDGTDGPIIEIWCLDLTGGVVIDVRGQDGGQGGPGQTGGRGGRGGKGQPSHSTVFDCRRGPGWGGRGGEGGRGGRGGTGGNGGHGGRFSLYAPVAVLERVGQHGFLIEEVGGSPGRGGDPGHPGEGGEGGDPGEARGRCRPDSDRKGATGRRGNHGEVGAPGRDGGEHEDAVRWVPIDSAEFEEKFSAPAILNLEPRTVAAGSDVVLTGQRLAESNVLLVDGEPNPFTFISETTLRFTAPVSWGGTREVRVRQGDGTLSNPDNLLVLPRVITASPGKGIIPGSRVTLTGSGFVPGSRVRANGQDMPDVAVAAPDTLEFVLLRPAAIELDPIAERANLIVVLPTGQESNALQVSLDTYRVVFIGDSVAWGQGLEPHVKASALLANEIERLLDGRPVYVAPRAHSGAPVGVGNETQLPGLHGEVPTSYPTVLQQVASFDEDPGGVEVVVVSAGINDVNVRTILDPTRTPVDLGPIIDRHCHIDVGILLERVLAKFSSAHVIVTSYFPILSRESDLGMVEPFLIAMGAFGGAFGVVGSIAFWDGVNQVVENCEFFYERSRNALARAVDDANHKLAEDSKTERVRLASPPFEWSNAALAPRAWLFGVHPALPPAPADSPRVAVPRAVACEAAAGRTEVAICRLASAGHPNETGAHRYSEAILAALDSLPVVTTRGNH